MRQQMSSPGLDAAMREQIHIIMQGIQGLPLQKGLLEKYAAGIFLKPLHKD